MFRCLDFLTKTRVPSYTERISEPECDVSMEGVVLSKILVVPMVGATTGANRYSAPYPIATGVHHLAIDRLLPSLDLAAQPASTIQSTPPIREMIQPLGSAGGKKLGGPPS